MGLGAMCVDFVFEILLCVDKLLRNLGLRIGGRGGGGSWYGVRDDGGVVGDG